MQKLQCAFSNSVSHFIGILISSNAHAFDKHGSDSLRQRPLVVPLDRTLCFLSARSPLR